jgi:hypothetical protein
LSFRKPEKMRFSDPGFLDARECTMPTSVETSGLATLGSPRAQVYIKPSQAGGRKVQTYGVKSKFFAFSDFLIGFCE